jgi:hypothetical protein
MARCFIVSVGLTAPYAGRAAGDRVGGMESKTQNSTQGRSGYSAADRRDLDRGVPFVMSSRYSVRDPSGTATGFACVAGSVFICRILPRVTFV